MKSDYRKMIDEMLSKIKSEKKLKKIFDHMFCVSESLRVSV